jgi:hypothetical protein
MKRRWNDLSPKLDDLWESGMARVLDWNETKGVSALLKWSIAI